MMQGQRELITVGQRPALELGADHRRAAGRRYVSGREDGDARLKQLASYRRPGRLANKQTARYRIGEGLVGQCGRSGNASDLDNIPADSLLIGGGMLTARPRTVIVLPPSSSSAQVMAVIELASLGKFRVPPRLPRAAHRAHRHRAEHDRGTMRPEGLLKQSPPSSPDDAQDASRRRLPQTNAEWRQKAKLLAEQNAEVERKNQEIEQARREPSRRRPPSWPHHLADTSRRSSRTCRTSCGRRMNSILILGSQLADNDEKNMTREAGRIARRATGRLEPTS